MKKVAVFLFVIFFAGTCFSLNNGLALTPAMGWNPWNSFGGVYTEAICKSMMDSLKSKGLLAAGYNYFNVDDHGDLALYNTTATTSFPSGMVSFGQYVHQKGFKFGVYGGCYDTLREGFMTAKFVQWQADYVKWDAWQSDIANKTFTKIRDTLANCGRPMVLSIHSNSMHRSQKYQGHPPSFVPGLANSWRTEDDICSPMIWTPYKVNWEKQTLSVMNDVVTNALLDTIAGPGHWNDADMLAVGLPGLSNTEGRSHFSLWCIMASPLFIGADVRKIGDSTLTILKNAEAIAVDQDSLGRQAKCIAWDSTFYKLVKPLRDTVKSTIIDTIKAVVLFNRETSPKIMSIKWADLGFKQGQKATVRNLWTHANVGEFVDSFSTTVGGHDAVMLKMYPQPSVVAENYSRQFVGQLEFAALASQNAVAVNLRFNLPKTQGISIQLFDCKGRMAQTLVKGVFTAGSHEITYRVRPGLAAASVYIFKLQAGLFEKSARLTLMRK